MSTALTFLHSSSYPQASEYARLSARRARQKGFSAQNLPISICSANDLIQGGNLLFVLGAKDPHTPLDARNDAIPFWMHLHSLNFGSLKKLQFAILVLGDNEARQFQAFGNACNTRLGQLGGLRLHPFVMWDRTHDLEAAPQDWIETVLAKLSTVQTSRLETLAA